VDLIVANFGMSRASLYRLFEPLGGVSRYIRKQRLERTFLELTATEYRNKSVVWVARRYCFDNASAFTRLFHPTYGMTPRATRQTALGREPFSGNSPQSRKTAATDWLKRLRA
jgi:AraC-like DNA-binding protein